MAVSGSQNNLTEDEQNKKTHTCQVQNLHKATVSKTMWYSHEDIDQWNGTESLEISLCDYGTLIFDKGCEYHPIGEEQSFQKSVLKQLDNHMQMNELGRYLTPDTKINSNWIKDPKVKYYFTLRDKIIKLSEWNMEVNL